MSIKHGLFLIALLGACTSGLAQTDIDGEYTKPVKMCFVSASEPSGWECEGILEEGVAIKRRDQNSYYVSLKTRGANGHFCGYSGIARMQDSILVTRSKNPECKISISVDGNSASFRSEGEGCNMYCGARSTLDASDLKKKTKLKKHVRNG